MSDAPVAAGHNLPPITKLADEMTDHASKWSHHAVEGERHEREIMVRAYQLRVFAEDPAIELQITGLLSKANVPETKRSSTFTRYLNYAFHRAKQRPEKSQISRWAGALQFAWSHDPRPVPENVLAFIKGQGGDVECARKAKKASNGASTQNAPTVFVRPAVFVAPLNHPGLTKGVEGKVIGKLTIEGIYEKGPADIWFFTPQENIPPLSQVRQPDPKADASAPNTR